MSKLDEDVCKKASNFITANQEKFTEKSWNCRIRTSSNLTQNILNITKLHDLKMHALSHVYNYMYLKNIFTDGFIKESWVNIYEKNFYQEFHTHTSPVHKFLSGVIYLTDENSNIEFNIQNRHKIKPEFSQILIFPEDLPHRVVENEKNTLRISLAFNFVCCESWDIISL